MYILARLGKLAILLIVVLGFLFFAFGIHIITLNHIERRLRFVKNASRCSQFVLWLFNIKVKVINPPSKAEFHLIVCNHLGFFDIFMISSAVPTVFITSMEMRETPFLGLLTEMGGCLYVERRSRENIHNEIDEIAAVLDQKFNVVLYAEGTSTNGEKVYPFKKSLLMACAKSEANILPAVVNFREINGELMQNKFRDWVCWYGDMSFLKAIWNATQIKKCTAELEFLNEIEVMPDTHRKDVAQQAFETISSRYVNIPIDV
jgi:1-acyl-sn-glycerol-3-phosphate acyltransferase